MFILIRSRFVVFRRTWCYCVCSFRFDLDLVWGLVLSSVAHWFLRLVVPCYDLGLVLCYYCIGCRVMVAAVAANPLLSLPQPLVSSLPLPSCVCSQSVLTLISGVAPACGFVSDVSLLPRSLFMQLLPPRVVHWVVI